MQPIRVRACCGKTTPGAQNKGGVLPFRNSHSSFYGVWFGGSLLTTLDGPKINKNMRVLDQDTEVISGLYAAGDTSRSLFSGNYPEYLVGCANGRTLTEGRHAVRFINENE